MYMSKIDLPPLVREQSVLLMQRRLHEGIDLQARLKHAHWNVKGPYFLQLHQLFDSLHDEVQNMADSLAERITALGGVADGRLQAVIAGSSLPDTPLGSNDGRPHLEAISTSLSRFGEGARHAIEFASHLGDVGTSDLLTQVSRDTDKLLWLVEAHMEGTEMPEPRS